MKKKSFQVFVVYKFDDGSTERISWVDQETKLLCSYAGMYRSDDPILRMDGRLAFERTAQDLHDTKVELYLERLKRERYSESGKRGAAARWGERDSEAIEQALELIATLAAYTDRWSAGLGAKELWPEFYSGLDELGLNPSEIGPQETDETSRITWDGNAEGMQFSTFSTKLSTARKSNKK